MLRWIVIPALVSSAAFLLIVQLCRWLSLVSPRLSRVVACGVAMRVGFGLVGFWISYLHAPLLSRLQLGGGFWTLALDAQAYHAVALHGAEDGLSTISPFTSSPAYVRALAAWMTVAGTSPFSAVLFNTLCYVLTCVLMMRVFGGRDVRERHIAAGLAVCALTFSPMLVFVSTQALKDDFFILGAAIAAAGVYRLSAATEPGRRLGVMTAVAVLAVTGGTYIVAGIRVYYGFLIWCALAPFTVWWLARSERRWRTLGLSAATLAAGLGGFMTGGGIESTNYLSLIDVRRGAAAVASVVQHARTGFVTSGGNTNIAPALPTPAPTPAPAGASTIVPGEPVQLREHHGTLMEKAVSMATGLATLFVPLSLLRALSVVSVAGSGAGRLLSDVDTLFLDVTILLSCVLMFRAWRHSRVLPPYAVFCLVVAATLTVLLAYVVTNVGTLVRLRLMLAIPLWTLPLAWRAVRRVTPTPPTASISEHRVQYNSTSDIRRQTTLA
jgi:hypothetical protein